MHLPGYLFPNPSGGERDWKRKRGRERESAAGGFLVSAHRPDWEQVPPQCPGEPQLYTGRQIHTHSQLGLPVIRQQEQRAKYTLSQNHAFINTFTHPELLSREHVAEWHGGERLWQMESLHKRHGHYKHTGLVMSCESSPRPHVTEYICFYEKKLISETVSLIIIWII